MNRDFLIIKKMEQYLKNKIACYEPISMKYMASRYKTMVSPVNTYMNVEETYTTSRFKTMINLFKKYHISIPHIEIFHQYILVGYLMIQTKKASTLVNDCINENIFVGSLLCLYMNSVPLMAKYMGYHHRYINTDNILYKEQKTIIDIQLHYVNTCLEFDDDYRYKSIMDVLDTEEKRTEDVLATLLHYMKDIETLTKIVSQHFTKFDVVHHICSSSRSDLSQILRYLNIHKLDKDKIISLLGECRVRKTAGDLLAWWGYKKVDYDVNRACLLNKHLGVKFLNMLNTNYAQIIN